MREQAFNVTQSWPGILKLLLFQNRLQKLVHSYPKLLCYYRASKYLPFCEKDEVNAVAPHEDMKHYLWPSLISTLLVFIIMILYHQVFERNQQLDTKLYESLKFQWHSGNSFCKGNRNSRCTSSASAIGNAICI